MRAGQWVIVSAGMILLALSLLFPPLWWTIDDGVTFDITFDWRFSPVRYAGQYAGSGHTAHYGHVMVGLLAAEIAVVVAATALGLALTRDKRRSVANA